MLRMLRIKDINSFYIHLLVDPAIPIQNLPQTPRRMSNSLLDTEKTSNTSDNLSEIESEDDSD